MQPQGRHAHGGDPVGGVGHQVGVPPYGGRGCHESHCVGEAGGWVGQGEPGVGEGQAGEGFRLEEEFNCEKSQEECTWPAGSRMLVQCSGRAERKLWRGSAG